MRIGGLIKQSLLDYPGKIAAVIFTQGCNWRCPFCHNPALVVPRMMEESMEESRVLAFLEKRRERLDGVVISGGEPTFQADLPEFISKIKDMGYEVKLDTNGSSPAMLRDLLHAGLVDYLAMDVKAPLTSYTMASGARISPDDLRASIWLVKNSGLPHEFRTTVIPGLHTTVELKEIGNMIRGGQRYVLQKFIPDNALHPEFRKRTAFPRETMEELRPWFEKRVQNFELRWEEDPAPTDTCPGLTENSTCPSAQLDAVANGSEALGAAG